MGDVSLIDCLLLFLRAVSLASRVVFTEDDRQRLAHYIATRFPVQDGRMGNNAYKELVRLVCGLPVLGVFSPFALTLLTRWVTGFDRVKQTTGRGHGHDAIRGTRGENITK